MDGGLVIVGRIKDYADVKQAIDRLFKKYGFWYNRVKGVKEMLLETLSQFIVLCLFITFVFIAVVLIMDFGCRIIRFLRRRSIRHGKKRKHRKNI